ncbi:hypothetical protein [Streptomyces sp. NPDC057199]|uniref:hypothetical protein n=1 Tax=Streptomyces sp. NPDC057199 TaxID=3346047 RepID=UPI0036341228
MDEVEGVHGLVVVRGKDLAELVPEAGGFPGRIVRGGENGWVYEDGKVGTGESAGETGTGESTMRTGSSRSADELQGLEKEAHGKDVTAVKQLLDAAQPAK